MSTLRIAHAGVGSCADSLTDLSPLARLLVTAFAWARPPDAHLAALAGKAP